ncbi:MAG: type IV secretion system DNA-binding domain-containing protein [Salinisphaeraceae bacterium]
MERSAGGQAIQERVRRASQARWSLFMVPLAITVAAPLVPFNLLWLFGLIGILTGAYAASAYREATDRKQPPQIDSAYTFQVPEEPSLIKQLYMGHAMDFLTYRDGLDRVQSEYGEVTDEARTAYNRQCLHEMRPFFWSDDIATRHLFVAGSTGVGKSETYKSLAYSQISRGGGMIMFDAKGDEQMFTELYAIAKSVHREHDVMYLNLDRPEMSHTYNPLIYGSTRQTVSTAMKLEGGNSKQGDEFWKRLNRNTLVAAIICLQSQPGKPRFNFADLAALIAQPGEFIRYYARMPKELQAEREFVLQYLVSWISPDKDGIHRVDNNKYRELLLGLRALLMDFCHSEYRQLLNDYNPDIELKEAILTNKIIMISLPALADKQGVEIFGRLFLADLSRAVGQLYAERKRSLVPYMVFLDEYGSFADETHEELFQAARGANISLICSVQGRGFLDKIGKEFTANILTNAWNHLYLDVRDPDTRDAAIKLAGTVINQFRQRNLGSSYGANFKNWESGLLRTEAHGTTFSDGFREMREELLQPQDFNMDPGDGILVGKKGTYRMRIPRVKFDMHVPTLDEIDLPRYERGKMMGLNLSTEQLERRHGHVLEAGGL